MFIFFMLRDRMSFCQFAYGHVRTHANTREHLWTQPNTYGHTRIRTDTYDHIRTHANTYGHMRTHTNTHEHLRTHTTYVCSLRRERDSCDLYTGHFLRCENYNVVLTEQVCDLHIEHLHTGPDSECDVQCYIVGSPM